MVRMWNENADEATLSNYMGLVGMDEAASKECGDITLDLLVKFGILEDMGNGLWCLAENYEAKHCYLFGDVKTVDNIDKITEVLSNRPLTLKKSNDQAGLFSKALSTDMTLSGD